MKVYLHYEIPEDEDLKMTIKLSLPKSWKHGPFSQLQQVLIENYNKKHHADATEEGLNIEEFHLEKKDGTVLPDDGIVSKFVEDTDDIYLVQGKPQTMIDLGLEKPPEPEPKIKNNVSQRVLPPTESELRLQKEAKISSKISEAAQADGGLLQCKNFGCQKKFTEATNHNKACQHHMKPPIFHETRKYWACCPDKVAWDWESFTAIPGCKFARHCDVREGKSFLGGTDVRKAKEEDIGPQRIDLPKKQLTSLDKLSNLRKALVAVGVKGLNFDDTRDQLKDEITAADETIGAKVWDKVLERIVKKLENALT